MVGVGTVEGLAVGVVAEGGAGVLEGHGVGGVGGGEGVARRHRRLHVQLALLAARHRLLVLDLRLRTTHSSSCLDLLFHSLSL